MEIVASRGLQAHRNELIVFTLAHCKGSIEELIAILRAHKIERIVDISAASSAGRLTELNKEELTSALRSRNISYRHLPNLGGRIGSAYNSWKIGWRNASFGGGIAELQTRDFEKGFNRLLELTGERRAAIICDEAAPWHCHLNHIADTLIVHGAKVFDITSVSNAKMHKRTPDLVVTASHHQPSLVGSKAPNTVARNVYKIMTCGVPFRAPRINVPSLVSANVASIMPADESECISRAS